MQVFVASPKSGALSQPRGGEKVCIDVTDASAEQSMLADEMQHLLMLSDVGLR